MSTIAKQIAPRRSNDLAAIAVGTRLMHEVAGQWVPVTVLAFTTERYTYSYDVTGVIRSCSIGEMRRGSCFRPLSPDETDPPAVEAVSLELRASEPRPGLVTLKGALMHGLGAAVAPIAMADENGDIALAGHVVHGYAFEGTVVVIASDLDAPLDYAPGGVAQLIQGEWKKEILSPVHFRVLRGAVLRAFKAAAALTGTAPVSAHAPSLMVLTEAGVDRVTLLTKKKAGVDARAFTADEVFHKLRRGEPPTPIAPPPPPPAAAPVFDEERLARIITGAVAAAMPAMLAGAVNVLRPLMLLPGSAPAEQPPALPIPSDWITSTHMAARLPLTKARIDKLIGGSAIRGNTDLARQVPHTWTDAHGSHTEPRWNYDPTVIGMVKRLAAGAVAEVHGIEDGQVSPVSADVRDNGRPLK